MTSFGELLRDYMQRTGITDTELARSVGVRRQTVFRWKEGLVAAPRQREDVLRVAQRLRLTPAEQDGLLLAAGFAPEQLPRPPDEPIPNQVVGEAEPIRQGMQQADPPDLATPPKSALAMARQDFPTGSTRLRSAKRTQMPVWLRKGRSWLILAGSALLVLILILGIWALRPPAADYPSAGPGEQLVLVSQFRNFAGDGVNYNLAGRLQEILAQEVADTHLTETRTATWPETIGDEAEARQTLTRAGAALLIWGEYDSGRVLVHFTGGEDQTPAQERMQTTVATPSDLSATINETVPQEVRGIALLTLAQLAIRKGRIAQARDLLERVAANPPAAADARSALYFRLGYVYQLGEPAELDLAIRAYSQALEQRPRAVPALYNRGLTYLARGQVGDYTSAVEDFTSAVRLDTGYAQAYIGRGVVYFQRRDPGDDQRAKADFNRALALQNDNFQGYYNRGLLAIRTDDPGQWQADLTRAAELAPTYGDIYAGLCWGYVLDQLPAQALPHCNQAIELGSLVSLDSRATAHAQLREFSLAATDYRAFLLWLESLPPSSPYQRYGTEVKRWLAEVQAQRNPFTPDVLETLRVQ